MTEVQTDKLPSSFEEAHRLPGHSIEDFLGQIGDIETVVEGAGSWRDSAAEDRAWMKKDTLINHASKVENLTRQIMAHFPDRFKHEAYSIQDAWMQHNSRAFVRSRQIEKTTDPATSRIYLNPQYKDMLAIYAEILTKAEREGLRFKAKVFGFTNNTERIAEHFEQSKRIKVDPIVLYGYADSEDALLRIAAEAYEKHKESFEGRTLGGIPMKVADGFAIGSEPRGKSGDESLTSHREAVLGDLLGDLKRKNPRWREASMDMKKRVFAKSFRNLAESHNIDPDNIAFDLAT